MTRELPEWVTSHYRSLAEWERASRNKTAEGYVAHAASYDPTNQRYCVVWRMGAPVYEGGRPIILDTWPLEEWREEEGEAIPLYDEVPGYGAQ